jgi:hypothetical protein
MIIDFTGGFPEGGQIVLFNDCTGYLNRCLFIHLNIQ